MEQSQRSASSKNHYLNPPFIFFLNEAELQFIKSFFLFFFKGLRKKELRKKDTSENMGLVSEDFPCLSVFLYNECHACHGALREQLYGVGSLLPSLRRFQ